MKSISVFNNKGGVGKTTLTFHLGHALAAKGFRVLMIDADPQCNLTIYAMDQESIHEIWKAEDAFIDQGFDNARASMHEKDLKACLAEPRSLHFLLKPTEEGTGELGSLPPPVRLASNLDLLPGRLTLHLYEEKIAERWAGVYRGDPLAIRTVTKIREIAQQYTQKSSYDYVIVDTSPSLGSLNKIIISTVDGFFIPAFPDLFSLYGIRNIGKALSSWRSEFDVIYKLISDEKRQSFPVNFVTFLGYTIYNAKKYAGSGNRWNLAAAHFNYANQIPATIKDFIDTNLREHLSDNLLAEPIGGDAVMHTHNTFPAMAQHYHVPMWEVPDQESVQDDHKNTILGASTKYRVTKEKYATFCDGLLARLSHLG